MPFVNIRLVEGRSKQQKDEMSRKITDAMAEVMQLPKEAIWVVFEDVNAEEWYVGGDSVHDTRAARANAPLAKATT